MSDPPAQTDGKAPASWLSAFFGSTMGRVGAAVTAAVGGTLAVVFTPIRDEVVNWAWPENVQVVSAPLNVVEGEAAPLTITLLNRGHGPLKPSGVATVSSADGAVGIQGNPVIGFSALDGSLVLNQTPPLQIVAHTFGTQRLAVQVRTTRDNEFKGELVVNAAAKPRATTVRNITGEYDIVLNRVEGSMSLQQGRISAKDLPITKKSRYVGTAALADGRAFDVKVWRDGSAFHVDFLRGGQAVYTADGLYCTKVHDDAKWMVVNAKVVRHLAGPAPDAKPAGTIQERCPGFPQDLSGLAGDGWFFASVALD